MTTKGRSPELFFIDGRREAGRTGVYLLLGEREDLPLAYVGEGEKLGAAG